jgi:hypothetical protein
MRNLTGSRPKWRAASLLLACITTFAASAIAQTGPRPNLAFGKTCKASSVEGQLTPNKAVDGPKSQASRWGSNYGSDKNKDSAWFFVDLGRAYDVDSVAIYWEHSGAKRYTIQAWTSEVDTPSYSDAGWKTLLTDTTLYYQPRPVDMCLSFLKIAPARTRFVRIRCYQRMFEFGYSIMELEVYGKEASASSLRPSMRATRSRIGLGKPGFTWGAPDKLFSIEGRLLP